MHIPMMKRGALRTLVSAALIAAIGTISATAQNTGSIAGKVKDIRTGQYLENARVTVENTTLQTMTDAFGQFRIAGVPTGTADITVFYTGYYSATQTIEVSGDVVARTEVDLRSRGAFSSEEEVYELDAFVVKSQYDAQAAAIHEQRFAESNKAVIDAEALGNINEGNIGEFVKYLPGISINYVAADVRSIEVRGLGSNMTNVTVDGNNMASASSGAMNRSFELEQASLNNVERIEVIKIPTPDMPASSLGGSVNMVSKSAFERDGREIRYNAYVSANSEQMQLGKTAGPGDKDTYKVLPGVKLTYADVYSDGKLGIIFNYLASNQFNPQHRSQKNWYFNDYKDGVSNPEPIMGMYLMQDGPKNTYRQSANVKVDYKLSENTFILSSLQWNSYHSAFRNTNVRWDTGVRSSATNQSSAADTVLSADGKATTQFGASWRDKYGETWHGDIAIEHTMDNLKIKAGAYFSNATNHYRSNSKGFVEGATFQWKPNGQIKLSNYGGIGGKDSSVDIQHIDGSGTNNPGIAVSDLSVYSLVDITPLRYINATDERAGWNADATYTLDSSITGYLKTGSRWTSQTRDTEYFRHRYYYAGPDGKRSSGDEVGVADFTNDAYSFTDPGFGLPSVVAWPSMAKVLDYYNANGNEFIFRGIDGDGIEHISEDILAVYAMASIDIFDKKAAITGGVRWEKTTVKALGNADRLLGYDAVKTDYDDFYPSIGLRWDITKNIVARLAFAETIGRQNFSDLLPRTTVNDPDGEDVNGSVRVNNPGLTPQQAMNIDATLEYYTENGGVFSIGWFNKEITDYIQRISRQVTSADISTFNLPSDTLDYTFSTTINAGEATINGLELAAQQLLSFIPARMGEVSVFANATYLDIETRFAESLAEDDLSGFVKDTYNFGISYQKGGLITNLKYTHKGQELQGNYTSNNAGSVGTGDMRRYYDDLNQIDFDLEYRFNRRYTAYISARNLLNTPQTQILKSESADMVLHYQDEEFGVQFSIGVKGSF